MSLEQILLTEREYCHIKNNNDGSIELKEGPKRISLSSHETVEKHKEKISLNENQYVLIDNPYDRNDKKNLYGKRVQIIGPTIFSLYPGEEIVNRKIENAIVLNEFQAAHIHAVRDFKEGDEERSAGDIWMIKGPSYFIPNKYAEVDEIIKATVIGKNEGVYVKNKTNGNIRLVKGPITLMLKPDEFFYTREYPKYSSDTSRIDFSNWQKSAKAPLLSLFDNEAAILINDDEQRVEIGPKNILLEPFEQPFVLDISGNTPKRPNVHRIWKIKLGPDFMKDILEIRTKDNAELELTLRYKWKFNMDKEHPELMFTIKDFIGYATDTVAGIIRAEACKHNFESFNENSSEIIKNRLFVDGKPFIFDVNGFEIFDIDIKKIAPTDDDISDQLNDAIKSNMEVYVKKIKQEAELDAKKSEVAGLIDIAKERRSLDALEIENDKLKQIGLTETEVEKNKMIAEAVATDTIIRAKAEAEAKKMKEMAVGQAENEILQEKLNLLKSDAAKILVDLENAKNFNSANKVIVVPTDSKVIIGNEMLDKI